MIIIDTSVWIDHLRGIDSPLDDILGTGTELLHPFVFGELLLNGLPKRGAFNERLQRLKPAPLAPPADLAAFIVWAKLIGALNVGNPLYPYCSPATGASKFTKV